MLEAEYWDRVFSREDPWSYGCPYEQVKYRHTLELLPESPISNALELGCAEGIFTEMLAGKVQRLLAVDISQAALDRARKRCRALPNVSFAQHDLGDGLPGSGYDLVVCSEILYYLRDLSAIEEFVQKAVQALAVGGCVLCTHANMVSDDKSETGFDFNEVGAKTISAVFSAQPGLEFLRELRTELYRVQLFRRTASREASDQGEALPPREVLLRRHAELEHPAIRWGGCVVTGAEAKHLWFTRNVPILMYHRVSNDGPSELAPYRVAPAQFERQLAWLQREGWSSLALEDYVTLRADNKKSEFPGKPIVLTFDDAYRDFYEQAWPLLRRYGFGATVFVPVNYVGGAADWDRHHGAPAHIMSWDQIAELSRGGIRFGSHGCRHVRLIEMSKQEVFEDASRSKLILEDRLGCTISGYAYPYAFADGGSRRIIAEVGYSHAVCGQAGSSNRFDPFYVPRIEIFGQDTMDDFIRRLPEPEPTDSKRQRGYYELKSRRDRATYMGR